MAKFSPAVQTLVNNARRSAGAPARRPGRRLFDRCTTVHDGQRITFDLSTARTCPPGFFGLKNGGGVRVAKIEKVASSSAPKKTRAKKAASKPRKKAAKKAASKPRKKAAKKNGNGNGGTMTVASVKTRLTRLYKAKKVGEASKLRAKARKAGLAI